MIKLRSSVDASARENLYLSQVEYRGDIIVIGASTGGPGAIIKLLKRLPKDYLPPVVIVQHIQSGFIDGFVTWLAVELGREVQLAKPHESIRSGVIYVASTSGNLSINSKGHFVYTTAPVTQLYTPNIDYFFNSLLKQPNKGSAILLTGMGDDGAVGIKALADSDWSTFVQTPETCVVAGMPNAAVRLSPRHRAESPESIGEFLRTFNLSQNYKIKSSTITKLSTQKGKK